MSKKFFKKYSPSPQKIKDNKALAFLGDRLHRPNLWHLNRHSVAKAFAIGLFCTWIPFPFQTVLAASLAIFWCAHIPLSVVLVFVTNPITIPPMFYFAYRVGNSILGRETSGTAFELSWEWLTTGAANTWQPLVVGSLLLAVISSALGYLTIHLLWRHNIICRWKERKAARKRRKLKKRAKKNQQQSHTPSK